MKQRIISALLGLILLAVVFAFLDTILLNAVIGIICLIGVYELLNATGCTGFAGLVRLSMLMALLIPFARAAFVRPFLVQVVYIIVLAYFILLIKNFGKMRIEHFAMTFLFSSVVPLFFSCAVYIREDFGTVLGGFYLLLALASAWFCDTCAYFVGIKFGRRKLSPKVSPKKTVEGAIGGVVGCTLLTLLLALGYSAALGAMGSAVRVNYPALVLATPVFAVVGMLGDLSASVIKRDFGIKDYGHVMPGHGGVMDRFDSVLFTLPCVYIFIHHVSLVAWG